MTGRPLCNVPTLFETSLPPETTLSELVADYQNAMSLLSPTPPESIEDWFTFLVGDPFGRELYPPGRPRRARAAARARGTELFDLTRASVVVSDMPCPPVAVDSPQASVDGRRSLAGVHD
jgi:hypothetical protein